MCYSCILVIQEHFHEQFSTDHDSMWDMLYTDISPMDSAEMTFTLEQYIDSRCTFRWLF